jgi:acyl-CoA reductase-like NAD-dependent aldehyde dehydrogenase
MDVDKIGFTGSTDVGKLMMVYSGQSNLKRVTVETGRKSPQIITANTPDLDTAVRFGVNGIYANKGEMCSAGSRLLVDACIHDEFVERFVARTKATFTIGDPLDRRLQWGRSLAGTSSKVFFLISISPKRKARGWHWAAALPMDSTMAPTWSLLCSPA